MLIEFGTTLPSPTVGYHPDGGPTRDVLNVQWSLDAVKHEPLSIDSITWGMRFTCWQKKREQSAISRILKAELRDVALRLGGSDMASLQESEDRGHQP